MLIYPNTFYCCHSNTSNQIESGAIEHIFEKYLVRSDEFATVKSLWKNQQKIIIFGPKIFQTFSCFSAQLGENPNINSLVWYDYNLFTLYIF